MEEMVAFLLKEMPSDPVAALLDFLHMKQQPKHAVSRLLSVIRAPSLLLSDGEDDDGEDDDGEDDDGGLTSPLSTGVLSPSHSPTNIQRYMQRGARVSFSAVPTDDIMKQFTHTDTSGKSAEELQRIVDLISASRLAKGRSESEVRELARGFTQEVINGANRPVDTDGFVIIVDSGELMNGTVTIMAGEVVGEPSSLFYPGNRSQASTLTTATESTTIWKITHEYLDYLSRSSAIDKRERYLKFMSSVPIFSSMDTDEVTKICEALRQESYVAKSVIIKQGELGDKFFLVESGELVATRAYVDGQDPVEVMRYRVGDYVGELSLLFNEPRAANVVAVTDVNLLSLDRKSFKRLMGPIQDILMRNSQRYVNTSDSK